MRLSIAGLYQGYRQLIRNPLTRGWVIFATVIYLFSPLDLSPDLLPFLGQVDDVVILGLLLTELLRLRSDPPQPDETMKSADPQGSDTAQGPTVDVKAVSVDDVSSRS